MPVNELASGFSGMPLAISGASKRMTPDQRVAGLFDRMDVSGSGRISKEQFAQAFRTIPTPPAIKALGVDAVFAQLDTGGTGLVSRQDFVSGMKAVMERARGPHGREGAGAHVQTLRTGMSILNALSNANVDLPV